MRILLSLIFCFSFTNFARAIDIHHYPRKIVTSVSSAYTVKYSDSVILLSGASFTVTLPTAVGYSGEMFTLIHTGTSLTDVYTLDTTSSQTIGGVASGSYALYTNGESLKIVSDGTNWQILNHFSKTPKNIFTVTTAGLGTLAYQALAWERNGENMYLTGQITLGTTTSATATLTLPGGMSTAILPTYSGGSAYHLAGIFTGNPASASVNDVIFPGTGASTIVYFSYIGATNALNPVNGSAFSSGQVFSFGNIKIPINGWQP